MSVPQDNATIVCREVFDETSHPSNEEVLDYARRLGIDPDAEPHLLDLARQGLMAALPKGWSPCFHEASGAWYYYQAATGTTTWEHPLDAVYREMVEQARAGNRQMSIEEDSKATAKDLESHEEDLSKDIPLTKEPKKESLSKATPTRIPTKLAPLRKIERIDGARKKNSFLFEKHLSRRDSESRSDNISSLTSDRTGRDYTNLRFQDPKFYECPELLERASVASIANNIDVRNGAATAKKELNLREVLERSESLSPRHEKDWEQLSSKFSSEENIIDIDRLSASTLAKSERPERFDKEKHPSQLGHQKELTLSGNGSMFLKSNRSRDTTPSQDEPKLDDMRYLTISDEASSVVGDKLKSILREKQSEDDDKPLDEERKSVRFDLNEDFEIKFEYREDEWESESEDDYVHMPMALTKKTSSMFLPPQRMSMQDINDDYEPVTLLKGVVDENEGNVSSENNSVASKNSKVVGSRFFVQNVTENEHFSQMAKDKSRSESDNEHPSTNNFGNIKCIDLVSKSESDSIAKSSDYPSTSNFENVKCTDLFLKSDADSIVKTSGSDERPQQESASVVTDADVDAEGGKEKEAAPTSSQQDCQTDNKISDVSKRNQKSEIVGEIVPRPKLVYSRSFEDLKMNMTKEHDTEMQVLKREFARKIELAKQELEENFLMQKRALQRNLKERLNYLKREMAAKEEQEIQKLMVEMDRARMENLKKVRAELEVCYERERQEMLTNLKSELDERKKELLELRNQEIGKLEDEHERDLGEEKHAKVIELELNKQHSEKIEALKRELEKEFEELRTELRMQQREKITKITEDHEKCLAEILRDFRIDEGVARKMYKQRLEEIRADFSRDAEKEVRKQSERALQQQTIDFEKMRCEKRLLQDKYTALKEKYMKLKNDVRLAVERRSKRKEGYTTTSETERSASTRTRTERTESSEQNTSLRNTPSGSITNPKPAESQNANDQSHSLTEEEKIRDAYAATEYRKSSLGGSKSAAKFESDDTTTASETNANMMRKRKNFSKRAASAKLAGQPGGNNNNNNLENPVENIRKQLEKLEDLGDQLPSNETAYTLRYPFKDKAPPNASSELEFFRHRIHVERDSVRRAREALRQQKTAFQGRQRAWKQRSARATLEQLVQEERELFDMEVSLHRTRSLLGEKVIHLRHLEQSLERVVNAKRNETDSASTRNDELTLSDMSSASSGFSSTDLGTDTFIDKPGHYQESTEIIANLESLNSEIREIWGVLNKRQDSNVPPPATLMYSYLKWLRFQHNTTQPTNVPVGTFGTPNIQSNILSQLTAGQPPAAATQNIIAQYGPNSGFTTSVGTVDRSGANLTERSRNLRDWLRQTRTEATDLINPGQTTL